MQLPAFPHRAERPVFWLGLAGFPPAQRDRIAALFTAHGFAGTWRPAPMAEADAWVIAGDKVRVISDSTIAVHPGMPYERLLRLSLSDVTRPIAFATPVPQDFEPVCQLDPEDPSQTAATVARLERWLAPLQARFALGREIHQRGETLRHGVFHIVWRGKLVAVLDFRTGRAGLAPFFAPAMLADAEWYRRPSSAGEPPPRFIGLSTRELIWAYVRHTDADLLPAHYRERVIHYRGPARVPVGWLTDSQLLLQRELADSPDTLAGLRHRTGLGTAQVEKDLACLYHASCITSTPSKAARPARAAFSPEQVHSESDSAAPLLIGDSALPGSYPAARRLAATVPAALGWR